MMASSIKLHFTANNDAKNSVQNSLPELIQTPGGLAILELQGTINLPQIALHEDGIEDLTDTSKQIDLGNIEFPHYHPETQEPGSTSWMKRVVMYVGHNQRLFGEVKKLPRPWAVVRKRKNFDTDVEMSGGTPGSTSEDLEIAEIVKYRLLFSSRPEPVGNN